MQLPDLRAIVVSVDYADILAVTLPRMRHHFKEVWVVTGPQSKKIGDLDVASADAIVAGRCGATKVVVTTAFWEQGAVFNKWAALEKGLDLMGREGWIAHLDADVIWPEHIEWPNHLTPGMLCSPLRRMINPFSVLQLSPDSLWSPPEERTWSQLPIHRNVNEWAGYSQVYHASDPRLGKPPWHETNYTHAGAADSWFQQKWPRELKVRPAWECLHIGEAGQNWFGRATPYLDGSLPEGSEEKLRKVNEMWHGRAARRQQGLDPFDPEKLGGPR
jgi:hypothetical protein